MNDTTRRFLTGILERVDEARIVELRLFPALRQGGVESGVAVLAVVPPASTSSTSSTSSASSAAAATPAGNTAMEPARDPGDERAGATAPIAGDDAGSPGPSTVDAPAREPLRVLAPARIPGSSLADNETDRDVDVDGWEPAERVTELRVTVEGGTARPARGAVTSGVAVGDREVPVAPTPGEEAPAMRDDDATLVLADLLALPSPQAAAAPPPPGRYEILTARYRLVFKGPDRGEWDLEIVHEADAPLATLERVVQGVARRSGDTSDALTFSAESLRRTLDQPAWA